MLKHYKKNTDDLDDSRGHWQFVNINISNIYFKKYIEIQNTRIYLSYTEIMPYSLGWSEKKIFFWHSLGVISVD